MTDRNTRLLPIVAVALLIGGCSGDKGDSGDSGDSPTVETVRAQVEALAATAQAKGYTTQHALLADGVVTEAEYRQAYVDATQCMVRAGMKLEYFEVVPSETGPTVDFLAAPGSLDDAAASSVSDDCELKFDSLVGQGWQAQHPEYTPEAARLMTDCLATFDIDATAARTQDEFRAAAPDPDLDSPFYTCLGQTRESLREAAGVTGPPP